jgi:hypothetical protein
MVRHECPSTHGCCQYVSDVDRQWTFFSYQGTYSFDIYKKKVVRKGLFLFEIDDCATFMFNIVKELIK